MLLLVKKNIIRNVLMITFLSYKMKNNVGKTEIEKRKFRMPS